jgi:hypothetical protein
VIFSTKRALHTRFSLQICQFLPRGGFPPALLQSHGDGLLHQFSRQREGMPMNSKLSLALTEFSKGRWAAEPSDEPPLHPTELNLVTRVRSGLGKLAPLAFARYLITFFIGVTATLAWQSYHGATREEMIASAPANLDSVLQSIDKLAAEIIKVQAAEQDILDKISTAPSRPAAALARNPVPRSSQARP